MSAHLGAGWHIHHLSDRCVELVKESYEYRRLTGGRDGFVRVRAEPGMKRAELIDRALKAARDSDIDLSFRIAHDLIPTKRDVRTYVNTLRKLAGRFQTPEDESVIGRKHA